ncbi:MAG: AraC family transcriptional regulator [Planctomycetes bacterium]|nr:AraC family transcriptional regulator [Planctomycetota bacterium]
MTSPLAEFPLTSTTDPDEAQSILSRELADVRFRRIRDRRSFHLEMNGVHLGRTLLGFNRFAADTLVDVGSVNDVYVFVIGTGPPSVFELDDEPIVCAEDGAMVSPSRRLIIRRPAGSGLLVVRAKSDALEERLGQVIDRSPRRPLAFDRRVDLARGAGAHARHLVRFLVESLQRDGTILEQPLLRAGFNDMLVSALLSLPSNYSEQLSDRSQVSVAPGTVRRAEAFMEANATEAITVSDLVNVCGCSSSALYNAFRRFRGYTPMQFLAESRLESAREALESPAPGDTVTSIAYACGFPHLGRFSGAYRRCFGELPSETLRRADPTSGA